MVNSDSTLLLTANKDVERFLSKIIIPDNLDACWEWQAGTIYFGYGHFWYNRKGVTAHRFIYEIATGHAPQHLCVCHSCDNPRCCNPNHLWLGTSPENTQDSTNKNRRAKGSKHGSRTKPETVHRGDSHYARRYPQKLARGEKHGNSKLSDVIVREMRDKHNQQGISMRKLATMYNVSRPTVRRAISGKTWAHV